MKGHKEKVKPLHVWCRQQYDIYSQRLGQGAAFHLETHKLAKIIKATTATTWRVWARVSHLISPESSCLLAGK